MTKEEYISIRDDQRANKVPYFHFYWKLKNGRDMDEPTFGKYLHMYVLNMGHMPLMYRLHEFVERELNEHFKLS